MTTISFVILLTFISGVIGTGIGGILGAFLGRDSSKVNNRLLAFAGGVMLSVVCFDLVPEAIEAMGESKNTPVLYVIAYILIGYMIIFLLNLLIEKKESNKSNSNIFMGGIIMALAIALHNFPVGTVIGASYVGLSAGDIRNGGFIVAVVIGLHNIPEGMSVSLPLSLKGVKKWIAVLIPTLSGVPTVLGAVMGYTIGEIGSLKLSLLLSIAAGAMIYVIFEELLPEGFTAGESKISGVMALLGMALGLLIIFI